MDETLIEPLASKLLEHPTSNIDGYYNASDLCMIAGITMRTLNQWEAWIERANPDFPGWLPPRRTGLRRYYDRFTVELVRDVAEAVRTHGVSASIALIMIVDGVSPSVARQVFDDEHRDRPTT